MLYIDSKKKGDQIMSLWSRFWRAARAVVRAVIRVAVVIITFPIKSWDLVFGWVGWPRKRLKLHIAVLQNQSGPLIKTLDDLLPSIELLKKTLKDRCNV